MLGCTGHGLGNPGGVVVIASGEMRNDVCHGPLGTGRGVLPGLRLQRVQVVLQTVILGLENRSAFFDGAYVHGSSRQETLRYLCPGRITLDTQAIWP